MPSWKSFSSSSASSQLGSDSSLIPTLDCTYVINEWSLVTLWHKSFEHTVFACKQYLVMKLRPSIDSTLGWNSFWGRFLVDFFFWDKSDLFMLQYFVFVSSLLNHTQKFAEFWTIYKFCENHRNMVSYLPLKKLEDSIMRKPSKCMTKMQLQKLFYFVVNSIDTKLKYQPSSLEY